MGAFKGMIELSTHGPDQTQHLGSMLGSLSRAGDLILLSGTLGAGKTTLTQGIAWGGGSKEYAHSPTFILVHEYAAAVPIYHLDLYRIENLLEVEDLGIYEFLIDGVCVIEWAEKAIDLFPGEHLLIELREVSEDSRDLTITASGERYRLLEVELVEALKRSNVKFRVY